MRYNTGGFNAPSREAIYYRMNKLAYGEAWVYDYERFVEYDAINRKTAVPTHTSWRLPKDFEPLHAPIVVKGSWRNAKNNSPAANKISNMKVDSRLRYISPSKANATTSNRILSAGSHVIHKESGAKIQSK